MQADEIRFLFAHDRWATRRVLTLLDGLDPAVWTRTHVVHERGLGGILVPHLDVSPRWRRAFQDTGESPEPEREPLPTTDQLLERWEAEGAAVDVWPPTVTEGFLGHVHDGVPDWQMLLHVVSHGTQHRAEAAALLTAEGRSPGEHDLMSDAEKLARAAARRPERMGHGGPRRRGNLEPRVLRHPRAAVRFASDRSSIPAGCRSASGAVTGTPRRRRRRDGRSTKCHRARSLSIEAAMTPKVSTFRRIRDGRGTAMPSGHDCVTARGSARTPWRCLPSGNVPLPLWEWRTVRHSGRWPRRGGGAGEIRMPDLVVNGAQMTCTFGTSPSALTVMPAGTPIQAGGQLLARVADMIPMSNIAPFGMCTTPSNPQVAAATAAAQGVLTPQPCIPVTTSPWAPGSTKVTVGGVPALTSTARCMCAWGGSISIVQAGQVKVTG